MHAIIIILSRAPFVQLTSNSCTCSRESGSCYHQPQPKKVGLQVIIVPKGQGSWCTGNKINVCVCVCVWGGGGGGGAAYNQFQGDDS